jgi:7-cyano-7-deazaguanine synthase
MSAMTREDEVFLLMGGGLDSTALIPFYHDRNRTVRGIHVDYGQPSAAGERRAALAVCQHYALPFHPLDLGLSLACQQGEYRGRNALLLLAAVSLAPAPRSVAIGIHAGVPYYDTTATFLADINRLFDGYTSGAAHAEAPFLEFSKADVYAYGLHAGVPFNLTFSCERSSGPPCGVCPSCQDRSVLYAGH